MRRLLTQQRSPEKAYSQEGQTIIEFILMVVVALALVGIISRSFRQGVIKVWGYYIQQVTGACPNGCPTDYRL